MAKRIVHECDLSKQEIGEDETLYTLKLAKKGTKSNMTYELSASAAEKLLAQLNGRKELAEGWDFVAPGTMAPRPPGVRGRTLGDLEASPESQDDSSFVAEKKAALREAGVIEAEDDVQKRELPTDTAVGRALGSDAGNGCRHINKSRIKTTLRDNERFIYRTCMECRKEIPEITSDARKEYMGGKAPKGVRIRDL